MKSFLSKYWKRILILIAIIFIVINIVHKCVAPHKLVEEYSKYGPDVQQSQIFDSDNNNNSDYSNVLQNVQESSPFDENIFRIVIFLIISIIVILIISDFANKKSSGAKKK